MDDHHRSSSEEISCSICLDSVHANGVRSVAKLKCGHKFHLDCIGSQFNMKGEMQCPNCREVESGNWLYVNGATSSVPEPSVEDWFTDVETFDFLDTDMGSSYRWCLVENASQTQPSYERAPSSANLFPRAYNSPPERLPHPANARVAAVHDHHHHHHRPHHHHHQHHPRHRYDHHRQQQQRQYGMALPEAPSTRWLLNSHQSSPEIPHDQGSSSSEAGHLVPWCVRDPIAFSDRDSIWGPPPHHRYGGSVQDSSGVRTIAPGEWLWS